MTLEAADAIGRALMPKDPLLEADIAMLSNVSFEEMILHFMVESDEAHPELPRMHHRQLYALCRLFLSPHLPDARVRQLTEAIKNTELFTYAAKLLRREITTHKLEHEDTCTIEDGVWQEIVVMCVQMVGRAMKHGRPGFTLVMEGITADFLFAVELWNSAVQRDSYCESRRECTPLVHSLTYAHTLKQTW